MISLELFSKIKNPFYRPYDMQDELSRLSHLEITAPITENDLSSIIEMTPKLKIITISATNNITNLPANLRQLAFLDEIIIADFNNRDQILAILSSIAYVAENIKTLSFVRCNLNNLHLPINFPHFINLEKLKLEACIIGDSLFKLAVGELGIEELYIKDIEFTTELPENFAHFINLKKLNIVGRISGESLFKLAACAIRVEELYVEDIEITTDSPENFPDFINFKKMNIAGSISGESFFKLAAYIPNIEELDMEGIELTSDIPANLPMLNALKVLYLNESKVNGSNFFIIVSKSPNIELLHFYWCEEIINFPQETELPLLPKLKAIHSSLSNISAQAFKQLIDKSINLKYLDAELTKTISADVKGLQILETSKDAVSSEDLVKVFNNNPNLERLVLGFRRISLDNLPAKFNNLNSLLEIEIREGNISGKLLAKLIPCFSIKTHFIANCTSHNHRLLPENALTLDDEVILASKFDIHLKQSVRDGFGKDAVGLSIVCLKAKPLRDIIISRLCFNERAANKPFFNFLLMYFDPRIQAMFYGIIVALNKNNILNRVFNQKKWHLPKHEFFHIFINCCLFKSQYDMDQKTRQTAYRNADTIDFESYASVYDKPEICFIELFDNILSFMSAPEVEVTSKRKRLRYY